MKKEIKIVDKERGICRVTTLDERWYDREAKNPVTGLREFESRPSVTYIGHFYPKGKGLENWHKKHGEESDVLMQLAAERGSKVHQAIEALNRGETVSMGDKFVNSRTGELEEITTDEYGCVMSYRDWWEKEGRGEYEILGVEEIVWPTGPGSEPGGPLHWAGTLDVRMRRKSDGTVGVVDLKTSQDVYSTHITQVSALAKGVGAEWGAVLQVGYRRTVKGYKWTDIALDFNLFLASKTIWAHETSGEAPLQKEYPLALTLSKPETEKPAKGKKVAKNNQEENA